MPLPLDVAADLSTRPFRVGEDEQAWLEVNNRAFHAHPEQGGWSVDTLRAREKEPWFDPDGFLLHERDGRLAGFCWTKVHADARPAVGRDLRHRRRPRLPRPRASAGRSRSRGWTTSPGEGITVGMLYVDDDNTAAVSLYESLGFTVHRTDRAYTGDIQA